MKTYSGFERVELPEGDVERRETIGSLNGRVALVREVHQDTCDLGTYWLGKIQTDPEDTFAFSLERDKKNERLHYDDVLDLLVSRF